MHVGMLLLYNLFQNCHTWLSLFINGSFLGNLQEYNQFQIYDNKTRPQWQPEVAYILLSFIWLCYLYYHYEILEMTFENNFLLCIISVLMRFKEGKYEKLYQKKVRYSFPKNIKFHFCPVFQANKFNFINNFTVRFIYEDDVTPSQFLF